MVNGVNCKGFAENVGQLASVTIFASDNLLLLFIIVGLCQKMPKDEFGCPNTRFGVVLYGNTVAIIAHSYRCRRERDVKMLYRHNIGHFADATMLANAVIQRIH